MLFKTDPAKKKNPETTLESFRNLFSLLHLGCSYLTWFL